MLEISVAIELIFKERDFLSRIDAVAEAGLPAFELWGWRDYDIEKINEKRKKLDLKIAILNLDPIVNVLEGDAIPTLLDAMRKSCETAEKLDCKRITVHLNDVNWGPGEPWYSFMKDEKTKAQHQKQRENYVEALKAIAPVAEEKGITMMLEPLNTIVDHKGNFLSSSQEAIEIIREVNSTALRLLFDCYHQQITEGNLINNLGRDPELIGHIHVADVPGRHEPGTGEINYFNVIKVVKDMGYDGYIGLEYVPSSDSLESFGNIRKIIEEVNNS